MSDTRKHWRTKKGRVCGSGKICYDLKEAMQVRTILLDRAERDQVAIYKCRSCKWHHLTSKIDPNKRYIVK